LGTVPGVLSLKNVQKQDGMRVFFFFFHFRLHLSDLCGVIGYCAWSFVHNKCSKTNGMLAFFYFRCTFLTFVVSLGTVPGVLSLRNVQKQDEMLAFSFIFVCTFLTFVVAEITKIGHQIPSKSLKMEVLGALGGAPGGIWTPKVPKAQKT